MSICNRTDAFLNERRPTEVISEACLNGESLLVKTEIHYVK